MSNPMQGQPSPDWRFSPAGEGGASGMAAGPSAPGGRNGSAPQPRFDAVGSPPSETTRASHRLSEPESSRSATVVTSLLLAVVLLAGFYAVVVTAAKLLSETWIEPGSSLVNYSSFALAGGLFVAWLAAAAVGVGVAVRLRGSWSAVRAPLAAAGALVVMVVISFLGIWPYR